MLGGKEIFYLDECTVSSRCVADVIVHPHVCKTIVLQTQRWLLSASAMLIPSIIPQPIGQPLEVQPQMLDEPGRPH
jgi:hypothetical protein